LSPVESRLPGRPPSSSTPPAPPPASSTPTARPDPRPRPIGLPARAARNPVHEPAAQGLETAERRGPAGPRARLEPARVCRLSIAGGRVRQPRPSDPWHAHSSCEEAGVGGLSEVDRADRRGLAET
jgi:hypothetical protein